MITFLSELKFCGCYTFYWQSLLETLFDFMRCCNIYIPHIELLLSLNYGSV